MKALTLWQPWASAIAHGFKKVENRPWRPPAKMIGQRFAIHAGKTYDKDGEAFLAKHLTMEQFEIVKREGLNYRSVILATVHLVRAVEVVPEPHHHICESMLFPWPEEPAEPDPVLADPMCFGPWGWVLDDVRVVADLVNAKGALGLWEIPTDIAERVGP